MKRGICLLAFVLALSVLALPARAAGEAAPPAVTAQAYVVMDADTGQILIEKNSAQRRYPASITKIMTMALALEQCGGDVTQQVTVSYEAVHALEYGSSHVALQPDEVVTLNDLFQATMLASANDAANVLAEYTAGSMAAFAVRMNEKAAALGLADTHFVNANGLHDDGHYTTAADMARLTRWALTVPGFAALFGATEYVMPPTNKQSKERRWGTDNCMLVENKYQYEGTTGGKSGWTHEAGYTMVETAVRGERSLICVVLGCAKKYDKFSDCIALLDYCFDNFVPVTLAADAIETPKTPVFYAEGAPSVGAAPLRLAADGYPFLLHRLLDVGDVQATFETPEEYQTGQPFAATMTLSLREGLAARGCMYAVIGAYPLGIDDGSVEALLDANTKEFVDRPARGALLGRVLAVAGGILLLLAALAGLRIAYVAHLKAQRQRRRRRRAPQSRMPGAGTAAAPLPGPGPGVPAHRPRRARHAAALFAPRRTAAGKLKKSAPRHARSGR